MRLLLALALIAGAAHAQGTITGTVRDATTGEALPGASVRLEGTVRGAATNVDGRFAIRDVPPGLHTVQVAYIGYERFTLLRVGAGGRVALNVELRPAPELCSCIAVLDRPPVMARSPFTARVTTSGDWVEGHCCRIEWRPHVGAMTAGRDAR